MTGPIDPPPPPPGPDPIEALLGSLRADAPAGLADRILAAVHDPALAVRIFWDEAGLIARRLLPLALVLLLGASAVVGWSFLRSRATDDAVDRSTIELEPPIDVPTEAPVPDPDPDPEPEPEPDEIRIEHLVRSTAGADELVVAVSLFPDEDR